MDTASTIRVALSAGLEKLFLDAWPQLKPGDGLTLTVLSVRDDQRALVDFGRFRALAEVAFPVTPGEVLAVRVIDTRGPLHLAVVRAGEQPPDPPAREGEPVRPFSEPLLQQVRAALDRLLDAAGDHRWKTGAALDVKRQLADLQAFLEPLRPEADTGATAQRLRRLCENCGVFFEPRLQAALSKAAGGDAALHAPILERVLADDLKARLGGIRMLLQDPGADPAAIGGREAAALARCVDSLLEDIGRRQLDAARRPEAAEPVQVVHFSLPLAGAGGKARLKIGYPRRKSGRSREGFRAALLLDLDRLGETRVDLWQVDRHLSVAFFVKTPEHKAHLDAGAEEVRAALTPFFEHVQVNVSVSDKKILDFEFEDLQPADARRLDVRV
jgi:hypothetical protein